MDYEDEKNPFGKSSDSSAKNPFDDSVSENSAKNPFDDTSEPGNPFDDSETEEHHSGAANTEQKDQRFDVLNPQLTTLSDAVPPDRPKPRFKFKTAANIVRELVPAEGSIAQHHELFLQEIEAVDEYWGPTFRGVYETGEHEQFLERLDERIKKYDREIERMCSHHYQGFIDSVHDLLRVGKDASRLKQEVVSIDKEVRASSTKVIQVSEKLVKARTVESNIAQTVTALSACLPVLQMFSKLLKQLKEKKYHPALKSLEQLEHTHLPKVANYRFSRQMCDQIPKLRDSLKEASMTDLKDFLENIRKYSPKMGEIAMRQTAEILDTDFSSALTAHRKPSQLQPNPFTGVIEYEAMSEAMYNTEEDLSAADLVDFSPVYRCLHIYTVLGERDIYERYYRKQRAQQCTLTLQPPTNMHEEIDGYRTFFHGIVGFFVCEDHILNTGGGLVSREYLEEVWSGALSKIIGTLRNHSAYCTDAALMLKIKNLMMLFASTLQSYGYQVDKLYELLQELKDHYNEVLMQRWVSRFRDIFEEDNYHPIQVSTIVEYNQVTATFPLQSPSMEFQPFPKQFPFSAQVPRVYVEVKEFIISCLEFSRDLQLPQTELDETVRKSTNLLLTRTLSGCLSSLIRKPSLSLLQLIQIVINTVHLEETNIYLENYISEVTEIEDINQAARLQARSMFKDIRAEAEEHIYKKLVSKMDEFIELANYDWTLNEPMGTASPWLMDLIAFLKSVFESFTNLPTRVAQVCCLAACQHLAKAMMSLLADENVKVVTNGALSQLDLDLCQCETFAVSEPVPGLEEGLLIMCFLDLRQLLDLFLSWDWTTYFADFGKTDKSKYQRVQPAIALRILDKLREADKKSVFSLNKKDRDKAKLLEVVTKQLRGLVTQTTN